MKKERLFECPDCQNADTAEKWNEATRRRYGPEIEEIDGPYPEMCVFTCPYCLEEVDGSRIKMQ